MQFDTFFDLINAEIGEVLKTRLNIDKLFELRLRVGLPAGVNYGGKYFFLCKNGISLSESGALTISEADLNAFIIRAGKYSVYAINSQICGGYISLENGIRVGLAGEAVMENGVIKTIKNISSVNVRFPHEIMGCSAPVIPYIRQGDRVLSTLILSPPGCGKTTLLRDIARQLSSDAPILNVLVIDERSELAAVSGARPSLNVGKSVDVISGCTKAFAFVSGIRALRPDVIVTDELFGEQDMLSVENAAVCGVSVIASAHAGGFNDLVRKRAFAWTVEKKLFDRFVVLKDVGRLDCVLGSEGERL